MLVCLAGFHKQGLFWKKKATAVGWLSPSGSQGIIGVGRAGDDD